MLDVAHDHVGGFLAAGVYDGTEIDAGCGYVLGSTNTHESKRCCDPTCSSEC